MSSETERLGLIAQRDGEPAARRWAERTLRIYREAAANPRSFASLPPYRTRLLAAVRQMEEWLRDNAQRVPDEG